ncbi:uncharacterized protein [Nicotiana sylvestris]|uniref:uncharacterized protein n=1 Tax=Nicotiana sylvestris TaxID=4096 RepID=UPI00388CB57E
MAGSKKSKKKGEGASSKQKENSSQQKMEKILAQNATITQNSFDELMNEENVQTSNTQANKMKQGDNQRKGDSELDDSSVDEWADETSSEEEDTSEESSDEQAEQLTQTFGGSLSDKDDLQKEKGENEMKEGTYKKNFLREEQIR